jgi:hypothetical protein
MTNIINFDTNPQDKDRVKEMARRYFSRNPRLVKSFVRDLAFLLSVIKPRYDYLVTLQTQTPEIEQEKKNLSEIINNPGLLAKIIVIRERFPEEFTEIQKDPTIISRIEENPGLDINTFKINGDGNSFDPELRTLINSWPLFVQRTANPANFILLGGSSGTEFRDEVDVGQFINYANAGDIDNFYQAISKSPSYKRAEYLTSVVGAYNSAEDGVKLNIAKSVLGAIYLVEGVSERENLLNYVIPWAEQDNGSIFNQLNGEQINKWIRSLSGTNKESDQVGKFISETPYGNTDENTRNRFWEAYTLPDLSETMVGKFSAYLSSLLNSFQNKQQLLDLLSKSDFIERINNSSEKTNVGNNITSFCIRQPFSEEKTKSINLLQQIVPDDGNKKQLIEHLINWVISGDDNQKEFAKQNLTKVSLWPENQEELKSLMKILLDYYQSLTIEEKNNYQEIKDYLVRKGVWKNKRKIKHNTA